MADDTLGQTGQIVVSQAAAEQYAEARDLGMEEGRRELTALLVSARRSGNQPASGAEGWRVRSRPLGLDVTALVTREGPLAVVVHVHVRDLGHISQPRGRRASAMTLRPGEWRLVQSVEYRCTRCGHLGRSDRATAELSLRGHGIRCGACRSPYWWVPVGELPRGRPAKPLTPDRR